VKGEWASGGGTVCGWVGALGEVRDGNYRTDRTYMWAGVAR